MSSLPGTPPRTDHFTLYPIGQLSKGEGLNDCLRMMVNMIWETMNCCGWLAGCCARVAGVATLVGGISSAFRGLDRPQEHCLPPKHQATELTTYMIGALPQACQLHPHL